MLLTTVMDRAVGDERGADEEDALLLYLMA
jgi:hypothetical protein